MKKISERINSSPHPSRLPLDEDYQSDKEKHFIVVFFSFDANCHLRLPIERRNISQIPQTIIEPFALISFSTDLCYSKEEKSHHIKD